MSNLTSASDRIQQLRDKAAVCLEDAAQIGDPAQRDDLIREALAMLAEARGLQDQAECRTEDRSAGDPPTRSSSRTH